MNSKDQPLFWKLNTSNQGKFEDFKRLFNLHKQNLVTTHINLEEIDASPIEVISHKASQIGEDIIVEDTCLDIEGASFGINIKWLLDHLSDYIGHKAEWTVYLAFRHNNQINIFKGSVCGTIVSPKGNDGFGFDPVFLPNGSLETLAESKPYIYNARAMAVESLLKGEIWTNHPVIENWDGPWQKS